MPRTVRLAEAPSFGQPIIVFDSDVAGRVGVPGPGERGERWRDAADWVRDSEPSSPPAEPRAAAAEVGGLEELAGRLDPAEPVPAAGPLRRGGARARSPTRSARSACSSPSSCVRPATASTSSSPASGAGAPPGGSGCRPSPRWCVRPTTPPRSSRRWSRTSTATTSTRSRRPRPTSSSSRTSGSPTTRSRPGSAGAAPRSRTRSGCCSSRPRSRSRCRSGKLSMGHARALLGTPGPRVPGAARQAHRRRGPVGAGGRGGGPRAPGRARGGRARRRRRPRPTARRPAGSSARPVCSSSRSCSATTSRPGSRSRWAASRGKVVVEFSTLEDLERIYRLMTDGGRPGPRPRTSPAPS